MQKKLIAVAVASALAVPAMAFADTTVYGVLDAGYAQTKGETAGAGGGTYELDAIGFSTMTSSRLGVMNTEDLGGGTKIMTKIETGISGNVMGFFTQGSTTDGTTIDATKLGSRELNTTLMFDQGTSVKFGFGSTLIRDTSLGYAPEPGGNLVGNILNNNSDFSGNRAAGITVTQALDKASVAAQMTVHTTKLSGNVDNKSGNGWLVGGQYADGPISVGAAYQSQNTVTGSTVASSDMTRKVFVLGGSYDFGVAKVIAEYGSSKHDESVSGINVEGSGFSVGAQAPFGDILGFVQVSHGTYKDGLGNGDQTLSGYTVGGKYNLSKASYGYLSIGQNKVGDNSVVPEYKVSQFAVGVARSF